MERLRSGASNRQLSTQVVESFLFLQTAFSQKVNPTRIMIATGEDSVEPEWCRKLAEGGLRAILIEAIGRFF
jgi:hypothetical protein